MATKDDLLHFACGMHRGTAPTADGRIIDRFDAAVRAHRDAGQCALHDEATAITVEGDRTCEACGQPAKYHGSTR